MGSYNLLFGDCIKVENNLWFSAANYNGLYCYNLDTKKTIRIADFPNEDLMQWDLHHNMYKYQDSLIFIPYNGGKISIYNIKKEEFTQIEIPHLKANYKVYPDYMAGTLYDDTLYVIGYAYPGIVKVILSTYEVKIVYTVSKLPINSEKIFFGSRVETNQNFLYVPCCYDNSILTIDMKCDKVSSIKIGKENNQYFQIIKDNQNFYITTKNSNHILCWNIYNNTFKEIATNFNERNSNSLIYLGGKYIWIISSISGKICQVNKLNNEYHYFNFKYTIGIDYIASYKDGLYFLDYYSRNWFYINEFGIITDLQNEIQDPRCKEDIWKKFEQNYLNRKEAREWPLEYLLFRITRNENDIYKLCSNQYVGDKIWEKLNL